MTRLRVAGMAVALVTLVGCKAEPPPDSKAAALPTAPTADPVPVAAKPAENAAQPAPPDLGRPEIAIAPCPEPARERVLSGARFEGLHLGGRAVQLHDVR